jgi:hypothetical protein
MPNAIKGEVPLKLSDGREFVLVFDMDALVQAEDEYGKPLPQLMQRVQAGFFGAIRVLFWASMQRHQPGTSMAEVNDLLTEHSDAIEQMLKAYEAAMPAGDGAEGKEGGNPRGKPSGSNGAKRGSSRKPSGDKPRARSR